MYPAVEKYTKSAVQTLGFSSRTTGYPGHSLFIWFIHKICSPTTNPFVISNGAKLGKKAYENALIMKQNKNKMK